MRTKPWEPGDHDPRPCPVCGETWFPWVGSLLPCHSRCLFEPHEIEAIRADKRPNDVIAAEYGVSVHVLYGIQRRGR